MSQLRRHRLHRTMAIVGALLLVILWMFEPPHGVGADGSDVPPHSESETAAVVQSGTGRIRFLDIPGRDTRSTGRIVRYTVAVEGGLCLNADDLAAHVRVVLTSVRGWESVEPVHFVALSPAQVAQGLRPNLQVVLASPSLVDRMCYPLKTEGEVSCHNEGKVVLNARRWMIGSPTYGTDLEGYRTYLINHEIGHALGHGHAECSAEGRNAPVMLQQTLRLDGCRPYPYPR